MTREKRMSHCQHRKEGGGEETRRNEENEGGKREKIYNEKNDKKNIYQTGMRGDCGVGNGGNDRRKRKKKP